MTTFKLTSDFSVTSLALELLSTGSKRLTFGNFSAGPVAFTIGEALVAIQALSIVQAGSSDNSNSATLFACERLLAEGVEITYRGVSISVEHIELPRGLRWLQSREIRISDIKLSTIKWTVDAGSKDDTSSRPDQDAPVATTDSGGADDDAPRRLKDWNFLDALDGQLDVDLFVDLNGPLIGRRSETHEFRVPVTHGTIDFKRLERDVHWLERSFIDIEIVDDKLVLGRDILGLPFTSKAIMWWPLDTAELGLARQDHVHLRTLIDWQFPRVDTEKTKKSKLSLNHIATQNIRAAVNMGAALLDWENIGKLELLPGDTPALEDLLITGSLDNDPSHETKLELQLARLALAVHDLQVYNLIVDAKEVVLFDLDRTTVTFRAFAPTDCRAEIRGIAASQVVIKLS